MNRVLRYSLAIAWLLPICAVSQPIEQVSQDGGLPFYLRHFPAHEYRAHPQNWSIVQDERGIIYVGNYDGVLIYDGDSWETIQTPSNTTVRSLSVGASGYVYVGLQGDFGYLTADSTGQYKYVSLLDFVPADERGFWDVWGSHATDDYAFFQTKDQIFRWDGKSLRIWKSTSGYHTSFRVGNDIFVRERGVGLLRLVGDTLSLIPDGERFADEQVFVVDRTRAGELLIATQKSGLFLHDGQNVRPFPTNADDFLEQHRLYHGAVLKTGHIVLGMLDGGGLIILNSDGRVVEHLTESKGLPDGWVNYVYVDAQGGLWIALNNHGLVRFDPLSSISKYDRRSGIEGLIGDMRRHEGYLFVATSIGLFRLPLGTRNFDIAVFDRIRGITAPTGLVSVGEQLLVVSHDGLFSISGSTAKRIMGGTYLSAVASELTPGRLYLGSETGIEVLQKEKDQSFIRRDLAHIGEEVYALIEDHVGNLWASARSGKIYYVEIDGYEARLQEYVYSNPGVVGQIMFARLRGHVHMLGRTGFYAPEVIGGEHRLRYYPYNSEYGSEGKSDTLLAATSVDDKLWQVFTDRIEIVENCSKGCDTTVPAVLTYPKWTRPARVFVDTTGVAWISSGSMLVRYDPSLRVEKSYDAIFPAILRRVSAIDSNRLLYGGAGTTETDQGAHLIQNLPFTQNALQFEFSLPSYNDVSGNEYQYWLEGKDPGWSDWTRETSKNYTNLMEGTYRFHVRGRNAQGSISPTSTYVINILPPWYRSMWAYGVYLLMIIGLAQFARRYQHMVVETKRAKEQERELIREREVNERLQELNERLKQANDTLRKADRLKDEFLANTSHELRTPLTGILGCAAILREEVSEDQREFVEMIDENGERLLSTLDSLLDLARLRAGLMEMNFIEMDVAEKAQEIIDTYQSVAESKGIDLVVTSKGDVRGVFDEYCLESALEHLIDNAVKFTNEGRVIVSVNGDGRGITLEVADTGVGIDEQFMPFIFDEFKQESTGLTRSHEGNGLGLAVTARIVELMGGEIDVRSTKGVGTTFTVRFPLEPPRRPFDDDSLQLESASERGVTA